MKLMTPLTSRVSALMKLMTRLTCHVSALMKLMTRLTCHVSALMKLMTRLTCRVSGLMRPVSPPARCAATPATPARAAKTSVVSMPCELPPRARETDPGAGRLPSLPLDPSRSPSAAPGLAERLPCCASDLDYVAIHAIGRTSRQTGQEG